MTERTRRRRKSTSGLSSIEVVDQLVEHNMPLMYATRKRNTASQVIADLR